MCVVCEFSFVGYAVFMFPNIMDVHVYTYYMARLYRQENLLGCLVVFLEVAGIFLQSGQILDPLTSTDKAQHRIGLLIKLVIFRSFVKQSFNGKFSLKWEYNVTF